jgi:hypothetical protein
LYGLKSRLKDADVLALLKTGRGLTPANVTFDDAQKKDLLDFLFQRNQPPAAPSRGNDEPNISSTASTSLWARTVIRKSNRHGGC